MKPYFETKLCECGCGSSVNSSKRFVNGHNLIGLDKSKTHKLRIGEAQKRSWKAGRKKIPVTYKGKICPFCKNTFFVPLSQKTARFCSGFCFRKFWSKQHSGENNNMYGMCGEKSPGWMGGKSFDPYPHNFNATYKNEIRRLDQDICQECERAQKNKLDVHHINYNKRDIKTNNLVSLCKSCHMKTNHNRQCWEQYFRGRLNVT